MKRTYKKKSNLVNSTGYTPGYATERNPVNYIPSENITMANTPYPLHATPLDENGNPIGDSIVMRPGGEYKFPGAHYVEEIPTFGHGGEKGDWISAKISKLVHEGYPQKQAVAIAYSMYENIHGDGGYQLPEYQSAGMFGTTPAFGQKNKFTANPNIATPEQFSQGLDKITEVNPGEYGLGKDPNNPGYLSGDYSKSSKELGKSFDDINKKTGFTLSKKMSNSLFGDVETNDTAKSTVNPLKVKGEQPFQFFNQYAGVDIPTAASTLGSSIESGDTLGTVASGVKLAAGLARNFLGGMGEQRRKNYVTQQYYNKQREGMTGSGREVMAKFGGYYQEGGEQGSDIQGQVAQALQQGVRIEDIIQYIMQNFGVSQEEAESLVESSTQPSTPQLRRGGMMYFADGGEDDEENESYPGNENFYEGYDPYFTTSPGYKGSQYNEESQETPSEESKEDESKEENQPTYDKNSARDTWVAKTGLPWSEAKRLGYTSGSAKDNIKLLSELNDSRFNKKFLRTSPLNKKVTNAPANSNAMPTWEVPKTFQQKIAEGFDVSSRPKSPAKKPAYVDPYKGWYRDDSGSLRNADGVMVGLDGKPLNWFERNFSSVSSPPPLDENGRRMPMLRESSSTAERNAYNKARYENQQKLKKAHGNSVNTYYQDGGEQQIAQQVAQAMQQGMQPQEAMQMLMKSGMSQDQAVQLVQAILQQLQAQGHNPQEESIEQSTPQLRKGEQPMEGQQEGDQMQAIVQQIYQMLQQGAQPEQIIQMLVEAGIPQDQAIQLVQMVIQQLQQQGHNPQEEQAEGSMSNPQEEALEQGTPQMRAGGKYMRTLVGKTIKNYTYNPKTDSYIVSYE